MPDLQTFAPDAPTALPEQPPPLPVEVINPPFTISVVGRTEVHRYAEKSQVLTLAAIREDILKGELPFDSQTTVVTRLSTGKETTAEGQLYRISSKYADLAKLYWPVKRSAMSGLGIGIAVALVIRFIDLGLFLLGVNPLLGFAYIVAGVAIAAAPYMAKHNIELPSPFNLIAVILPGYLGYASGAMLLGAVASGVALGCMPGMAIGAAVGAVRRGKMTLAPDARRENALLRILIPTLIFAAVVVGYSAFVLHYLPTLLVDR